jgi:hypothetical protein
VKIVGGFTRRRRRDTLMRRLIPANREKLWITLLAFALLPIVLPFAIWVSIRGVPA